MNRFKFLGKFFSIIGILALAASFVLPTISTDPAFAVSSVPGERGGTWHVYDSFDGFQTKFDAEKIADGANANGQNTTVNNGDRISIRDKGYELLPSGGTLSTDTFPVNSLHVFRKRDGENILMRSVSTTLQYYEEGNDTWETIQTSYTNGFVFGYADYNINTDLVSYVYFGNSQEQVRRWTGEHTLLNGAVSSGATTITVDNTDGFLASGSLIFCNTVATYTGKTATTFTGVSGAPACADDRSVAEATVVVSGAPRGNIFMTMDNRLWIAGVTSTPQAVFFSKYGDATDFTTTTLVADNTDTSSGIFNLGEGGGGVVGMAQDEGAIYMFKKSTIRKATISDTTYTLSTLKSFDGKSQTIGATNQLSTFASGNEVFFITPDRQIMKLARVENVDYPQIVAISNIIQPTVDSVIFTSSTGIVFKDKAYLSARSDSTIVANDIVFVYNLKTSSWDSPIVGWNVSDFAVYDDGNGEELYFADSLTTNVYKVIDSPSDHIYDTTANWRSKQFTFGAPNIQKQVDSIYIEGYVAPNTTLNITFLLDEDGFTQKYETSITGLTDNIIYDSVVYNPFGYHAFGFQRFGSNDDESGKKKFRMYLNKDFVPTPFYNAQIEFSSVGSGQEWEITNFAFNVRPFSQPSKPSLFRKFQ